MRVASALCRTILAHAHCCQFVLLLRTTPLDSCMLLLQPSHVTRLSAHLDDSALRFGATVPKRAAAVAATA